MAQSTKTSKKYYDNSVDNYAQTERDFLIKSYNKTRAKSFLHKLGNSLGLVVVCLPLAGLLAAIGGIIMSKGTSEGVYTLGIVLADLGQTVLSNLGLLFMLAIVLGFTGNKGMALYATLIGYIAFVGFTMPFIRYQGGLPNGNPTEFNIWFWHGLDVNTQLANIFGLGQGAIMNSDLLKATHGEFARLSYSGIKTLNTGVLGGICLGFIYVWVYNKFKDLKLPSMLAFFEGEKFVAILVVVLAPVVASLFIIIWPAINYALGYIGIGLSYLPYGIDSFFYGLFNRWLLPFEAHPAFYGPLWWTSAGGTLAGDNQTNILYAMIDRIMTGQTVGIGQEANYLNNTIMPFIDSLLGTNGQHLTDVLPNLVKSATSGTGFDGTAVWNGLVADGFNFGSHAAEIQQSFIDYGKINWTISGDQLISIELLNNNPNFDMRDAWGINLKVTRYISGAFSNLMFMTPAVGFAIWSTLDKDRRKEKFGLYIGAIASCFILGVSEPVEFMLAFGAPIIFFGVYAPFYGLTFLFTTLFQVKLGSTFSTGLVDYIVNGIIPTVTRTNGVEQTRLWLPIVIGLVAALFAFPVFRYVCIKLEFAAPGSAAADEGIGVSESQYSTFKPQYDGVVDYLGGTANIVKAEMVAKAQARFSVKRADRVVSNEYTTNNFEEALQQGTAFIVAPKDEKQGQVFLNMLVDFKDNQDRQLEYKAIVKQEAEENKQHIKAVKEQLKARANYKYAQNAEIAQIKAEYKANMTKAKASYKKQQIEQQKVEKQAKLERKSK